MIQKLKHTTEKDMKDCKRHKYQQMEYPQARFMTRNGKQYYNVKCTKCGGTAWKSCDTGRLWQR